MNLLELPYEVQYEMALEKLNGKDLLNFCRVPNTKVQKLCAEESLWRNLFRRDYSLGPPKIMNGGKIQLAPNFRTAYRFAAGQRPFIVRYARLGYERAIAALLEAGKTRFLWDALRAAVQAQEIPSVQVLLPYLQKIGLRESTMIEQINQAIKFGNLPLLQALMIYQIPQEEEDSFFLPENPIDLALELQQEQIIPTLLGQFDPGTESLYLAVQNASVATLQRFLVPEFLWDQETLDTAFLQAIEIGDVTKVQLLVQAGADVTAEALEVAVDAHSQPIVRYLRSLGLQNPRARELALVQGKLDLLGDL